MVLIALVAFVWRVINTIPQVPSLLFWLLRELNVDVTNYYRTGGINETLLSVTLVFPLCVVLWECWLMFRMLAMSSNSIARERNRKTWELLLLTGMNIQQIVRAKWWAVVRQQWRDYALLAIMRIGVVSALAMNFNVNLSYGLYPSFSYGRGGPTAEPHITIVFLLAVSIVILSAALIAVLTMLNLMLTVACGILGGSITRSASLALPYSVGVRLLLLIILVVLVGIPGYLGVKKDIETTNYYPNPVLSTISLVASLIGATAVDGGGIAAGLLMRFGYNFRWDSAFNGFAFFSITLRGHGPAFLAALLLSIVIWAAFTYILLRQAEKLIERRSTT